MKCRDWMLKDGPELSHSGHILISYFSVFLSNCIGLFLVYKAPMYVAYTSRPQSHENFYLFWHISSICIHRHISVLIPRVVYLAELPSTCSGWALCSVGWCASELHFNGRVD